MNCYDDCYINNSTNYNFNENIDYLSNEIHIPNSLLIKCWKQSKYDISIIIPSTISRRLENISWRRLYKNLHNLDEISPTVINWYKDHDINWCYGPKFVDDDLITLPVEEEVIEEPLQDIQQSILDISDDSDYESELSDYDSEVNLHTTFSASSVESMDKSLIKNVLPLKKKRVKFNFIINSREIINGISIDYDFLDNELLNTIN
ncbi:hypothetical protein CLIB1444_02S10066 [[Candida] jaroonii]|uniref:Uncharacterized protein n=1 Tax=[Candida] jaroonii TaxID=467808 RepID=A0ACA9Y3X3_9ASCO|nr:hypothetical protein CLIB1444_02S10066 [[Candida] jaroonii]